YYGRGRHQTPFGCTLGRNHQPVVGLDTDDSDQRSTGGHYVFYCTDFYQLKLPIDFSVKNAHLCAGSVKNKYPYMAKILVTGGCGYIGSHTVVDLIQNGYDVISVDNNSRSNPEVLAGVERITG